MITKADLLKLAEPGIRVRLAEIQAELNELARAFPHIVKNADGTVPSVIPIVPKASSNGARPQKALRPQNAAPRKPQAERLADIRAFLTTHPGSSARAIGEAVGLSANQAFKLAAMIAKAQTRGNTGRPGYSKYFTLKKP